MIEYALRMLEFPQEALLTRVLARGALTAAHIDTLAATVAAFHASAATTPPDQRVGSAGAPDVFLRVRLADGVPR